jgi:uncharacterized protein YigE (DUF2233 family)
MVVVILCLVAVAVATAFWAVRAIWYRRRSQAIGFAAASLACIAAACCVVVFQHNVPRLATPLPLASAPSGPTTAKDGLLVERTTLEGSTFTVVTVDLPQAELRLYWKRPDGRRFGNFAALSDDLQAKGQRLVFACNAGMFDPGFTPCGLHVEADGEHVPLNLGDGQGNFYLKPNGVFLIDDAGARILDSTKYPGTNRSIRLATQSGPLLVIDGRINPQLMPNSSNRRLRSGVGVSSARQVRFIISEQSVTFQQLALLFRDRLGCRDALYLDGVISRFYLPGQSAEASAGDFAGILGVISRKTE